MALLDNPRDGGRDQEDVADERNPDGDADRLVAAPPRVGDVCTKERDDIDPVGPSTPPFPVSKTHATYQNVLNVPIPVEVR